MTGEREAIFTIYKTLESRNRNGVLTKGCPLPGRCSASKGEELHHRTMTKEDQKQAAEAGRFRY